MYSEVKPGAMQRDIRALLVAAADLAASRGGPQLAAAEAHAAEGAASGLGGRAVGIRGVVARVGVEARLLAQLAARRRLGRFARLARARGRLQQPPPGRGGGTAARRGGRPRAARVARADSAPRTQPAPLAVDRGEGDGAGMAHRLALPLGAAGEAQRGALDAEQPPLPHDLGAQHLGRRGSGRGRVASHRLRRSRPRPARRGRASSRSRCSRGTWGSGSTRSRPCAAAPSRRPARSRAARRRQAGR